MLSKKELLAKANKPSSEAMRLHPFYRGKIQTTLKCAVRDFDDFAIWYTPGVAAPCRAIADDPQLVYDYTNKGNTVAIVTDGTRVLGLGDIGPEAGLPVMEGKALLFKYLGGVDAVPICLKTTSAEDIINTVRLIQPSYGGINLEDISQPKCFKVLDALRTDPAMDIPVFHDDQQGTATVILAGLINALKITNRDIKDVRFALVGLGAANVATLRLLLASGVSMEQIMAVDSRGILHRDRRDIEEGMERDSIVFPCANPVPEIWPWEAKEAGARIVGTGRSDFSNQLNNSLGFPAIFRGTLDVRARTITDEMCLAASAELARIGEEKGLDEDHIIPDMRDSEIFPREAVAVGMKAVEQGLARVQLTRDELFDLASQKIREAREMVELLMREGAIAPVPEA